MLFSLKDVVSVYRALTKPRMRGGGHLVPVHVLFVASTACPEAVFIHVGDPRTVPGGSESERTRAHTRYAELRQVSRWKLRTRTIFVRYATHVLVGSLKRGSRFQTFVSSRRANRVGRLQASRHFGCGCLPGPLKIHTFRSCFDIN